MDELVHDLVSQYEDLKKDRYNLDNHCTEIAERMLPQDKDLFQDFSYLQEFGDKKHQHVFDSTAEVALNRFAAILDSLLTPRNSFWHNLRASDPILNKNKGVQDYFQNVTNILFDHRYSPDANFSSQNQMQYSSLGAYGTGAMFTDALFGRKGIRYRNIHLSELFLQENHQRMVDRICRRFSLTVRQAVQMFGDILPDTIKDKLAYDPECKYEFLHWVMPRRDLDPMRRDVRGMAFASYYISIEGPKILKEGGYNTFPYAVSRYEQQAREPYGRGPAMRALPAAKTLNEQKLTLLKQGHLAVDPVILAHDDGIVDVYDATPGSIIPGGVTKDGRTLVHPLPTGRIDIGKDLMDDERALINDVFLVTLFQILVESPEMTATEVLERTREKGILLAPTIGRQQSEYLGPLIEREIDLLSMQGILPTQPMILQEAKGEFKIIYDSPITRTQKSEWAAGAMRTVQQAMEVSVQTQNPSLLDYFNWDIIIPEVADIYGTPSLWLNDPEKIKALREARAEQQEQQQMIEAAPAMAGLAKASR